MRYSELLLPTLKETPTEAEVVSHRLLLRAGFIRKLSSGVYTYLTLGLGRSQGAGKNMVRNCFVLQTVTPERVVLGRHTRKL